MVPSIEFARLTAEQKGQNQLVFRAHPDGQRDRWRAFKYPIRAHAVVPRVVLRESPTFFPFPLESGHSKERLRGREGALVLGPVGRILPGTVADLLAVDGEPLPMAAL